MSSAAIDVLRVAQAKDQRKEILDSLKTALKEVEVFGNLVLVATYIEPETTSGGIIKPQARLNESLYQGKVGLVLKPGVTAFKYYGSFEWEGPVPKVGEWVFYRASDTKQCVINRISCRFIADELIMGRVKNPETIF